MQVNMSIEGPRETHVCVLLFFLSAVIFYIESLYGRNFRQNLECGRWQEDCSPRISLFCACALGHLEPRWTYLTRCTRFLCKTRRIYDYLQKEKLSHGEGLIVIGSNDQRLEIGELGSRLGQQQFGELADTVISDTPYCLRVDMTKNLYLCQLLYLTTLKALFCPPTIDYRGMMPLCKVS